MLNTELHSTSTCLHSKSCAVAMNSTSGVSHASKKHRRDSENESDENDDLDPVAFAQMTRSQRKCHRERRRRNEVNKGFDDLTSLLWDIDATNMSAEIENRSLRGKKQSNLPTEDIILSRVDLINCTISLLRRLHAENEQRKDIISTLTRAGTSTGAFDTGVNLTLPNLGNVHTSLDNDRARLATTEVSLLYLLYFLLINHLHLALKIAYRKITGTVAWNGTAQQHYISGRPTQSSFGSAWFTTCFSATIASRTTGTNTTQQRRCSYSVDSRGP